MDALLLGREICLVEPTSSLVIVLLLGGCTGFLVAVVRVKQWAVRAVCGASVVALAMVTGAAAVNDHYGYYTSWAALVDDMVGNQQALGLTSGTVRAGRHEILAGTVEQIALPGRRSRINRSGLVYLPPQYNDPKFRHVRFPVVELLHGSPGKPSNWVVVLKIARIADVLISRHLMGPLVLVMPSINQGHHFQECVNGRGAADDTYLATDSNDVAAAKDATTSKYTSLQKKAAEMIAKAKNISQFLDRDAEPAFANNAALPGIQNFIKTGDIDGTCKSLEAQAKQAYTS